MSVRNGGFGPLFLAAALALLAVVPASAGAAETERARFSWSDGANIGMSVNVAEDAAFANDASPDGIPDAVIAHGPGFVSFVDHRSPSNRSFSFYLCYSKVGDAADTDVTVTLSDPGQPPRVSHFTAHAHTSSCPNLVGSSLVQPAATGDLPELSQPTARCDAYWVKPHTVLRVAAPGFLANDSDPQGLALTGHVDRINFGVKDHPYSFDERTGALSFTPNSTPGEQPFVALVTYHVTNSSGKSSAPTTIGIFIQQKPPKTLIAGTNLLSSCAPPNNHAPLARPDSWTVDAGSVVDDTVLGNDTDPDGDPIAARVTKISFSHHEWSGMDTDGSFLYTAGPGTSRELNKVITYVAVDKWGAESPPATAVVTIRNGSGKSSPTGRASRLARASASYRPYWMPQGSWYRNCFGSGLGTTCYTILSVARAQEFNRNASWLPNPRDATRWCLKFGLLPMAPPDCAKTILKKGLSFVWDRAPVYNAARLGDCLLVQVRRHRTLRHPRSGEWGKPEYDPLDSLVTPDNGNRTVSGYATWRKSSNPFNLDKWRLPFFCLGNGRVTAGVWVPWTTAPG